MAWGSGMGLRGFSLQWVRGCAFRQMPSVLLSKKSGSVPAPAAKHRMIEQELIGTFCGIRAAIPSQRIAPSPAPVALGRRAALQFAVGLSALHQKWARLRALCGHRYIEIERG